MMLVLSFLILAVWIYLLLFRGRFWLMRERDDDSIEAPPVWPSVVAVIPARDEADTIARSMTSLIAQDYPNRIRIILVDDQSSDGTADIARRLDGGERLEIVRGVAPPAGWTGKLWAVKQGIDHVGSGVDYLWLTDADIVHAPDSLRHLVARAEKQNLVLVSLMAKLNCVSFAERFLIPAFVFFFAMLYPFAWVNRRGNPTAAAAGGCMLVKREALEKVGGIESVRHEIIDDCALARRLKQVGGIWLGLTHRAVSLRRYPKIADIQNMVSRSAYAELRYSPLRLAGALVGMILIYVAPPVIMLLPTGAIGLTAGMATATAYLLMFSVFQPILLFYGRSAFLGLALPLIGAVYAAFTLNSALCYWRGQGGMWKGRVQAWTRA